MLLIISNLFCLFVCCYYCSYFSTLKNDFLLLTKKNDCLDNEKGKKKMKRFERGGGGVGVAVSSFDDFQIQYKKNQPG